MPNKINDNLLNSVNSDILAITELASNIGWDTIREMSVYRILYLASVLYSFKYPQKDNPFSKYYHFDIDTTGPYSEAVKKSLTFLESNEFLLRTDNAFKYNPQRASEVMLAARKSENEEWLKVVIYILGQYGEGKVYDFVIRDPQYQDHLARNVKKEVNIEKDNKTISILNRFKQAFEQSLGSKATQISDKEYLTLYFEYIFSKVLKGEIRL